MQQTILSYLRWANPKSYADSKEGEYYDENISLFPLALNQFNDNSSIFGVIRSNIILHGFATKSILDHYISRIDTENLDEEMVAPLLKNRFYLTFKNQKIFIPTYSPEINEMYIKEPSVFKEYPMKALLNSKTNSLINPFKTYGIDLFSSPFTRLIQLDIREGHSYCFYHPEFQTIFVITDDGYLEQEIPLFDEKLTLPNLDNLFDRLKHLMRAYFSLDRTRFVGDLLNLGLISKDMYLQLKEVLNKLETKKEKIRLK